MTELIDYTDGCSFCHKCGSRTSRRASPTWSKVKGTYFTKAHDCDIKTEHIHWYCDCGYEWAETPVMFDD